MAPHLVEASSGSLESLMERYADGSDAAFTDLYRRMAPKLLGYLVKMCRDVALAEDALQNAFVKIHRARGSYVRGAPVTPWVLVIARRALYDEIRSARARADVLSDDGVLPERTTDEYRTVDVVRHMEHVLSELPGHYREAIELTKIQGLSGNEAARALSTTQSAIKLRVHRGYRLLRERLEAEEAEAA